MVKLVVLQTIRRTTLKNDGQAATTDEKMPFIAYICAACTALAAFVFACMTSMTGLVWMILLILVQRN